MGGAPDVREGFESLAPKKKKRKKRGEPSLMGIMCKPVSQLVSSETRKEGHISGERLG